MTDAVAFAARLRRAIRLRGRTLAAFAREADIPYRTLQGYVGGGTKPGADHLARMAEAGIDVVWVLTGRSVPHSSQE